MFKGVVIIIAFLCFYPVVAPLLYKDDFTPVSRTNELLSDVNPDVIYYMHTRLDSRLYDIYYKLNSIYETQYDDTQSIGRRYRRQDEIGTPLCVTVDYLEAKTAPDDPAPITM